MWPEQMFFSALNVSEVVCSSVFFLFQKPSTWSRNWEFKWNACFINNAYLFFKINCMKSFVAENMFKQKNIFTQIKTSTQIYLHHKNVKIINTIPIFPAQQKLLAAIMIPGSYVVHKERKCTKKFQMFVYLLNLIKLNERK